MSLVFLLSGQSALYAESEDLADSRTLSAIIEAEKKLERMKQVLERMKQEQEQYVARTEELKRKEGRISTQIDQLDRRIHTTQNALGKIRAEEKRLKQDIAAAHRSLDETQEDLIRRQRLFSNRLRTMYKRGRLRPLELLVSARNFPDFYRRWKVLSLVAQWDRKQLVQIQQDKTHLQAQKDQLEQSYHAQLEFRRHKSQEERRLNNQRKQKQQVLGQINKDVKRWKALAQQQAQDIAESQAAIGHYIEELEKRRQAELAQKGQIGGGLPFEDMAKKRGKLPWPLRGKVVTHFGRHRDRRLHTWTFNRGIDIQAPEGSGIHVVAPGLVVLSDWYRGYGRFLLLDHGLGYFTLYAHLSEVFPQIGDFVQTEAIIATSGSAGLNDDPKLHFELLKGKEPLDPLKWLQR